MASSPVSATVRWTRVDGRLDDRLGCGDAQDDRFTRERREPGSVQERLAPTVALARSAKLTISPRLEDANDLRDGPRGSRLLAEVGRLDIGVAEHHARRVSMNVTR